jgi:DNA-binding PadR family transcriptional regulator
MASMTYRRPGAPGITHVRLSRGRRRVLLVMLSGARNLHGWRLCQAAQIWSASLYPFLDHLVAARWAVREERAADGEDRWCYDLTENGRLLAASMLRLAVPETPLFAPRMY